jgi:hypothetical protein
MRKAKHLGAIYRTGSLRTLWLEDAEPSDRDWPGGCIIQIGLQPVCTECRYVILRSGSTYTNIHVLSLIEATTDLVRDVDVALLTGLANCFSSD